MLINQILLIFVLLFSACIPDNGKKHLFDEEEVSSELVGINYADNSMQFNEDIGVIDVLIQLEVAATQVVLGSVGIFPGSAVNEVDYRIITPTFEIPVGQTVATVQVEILDDEMEELPEYFGLSLLNLVGAQAGSNNLAIITIIDDDSNEVTPPPTNLAYNSNPASLLRDVPMTPLVSTWDGVASTFTVDPPLPSGLIMDGSNGSIMGTPNEIINPAQAYTVTAVGPGGMDSVELFISVLDQAPTLLNYSNNPVTYTLNQNISPNIPILLPSGVAATYALSGNLPLGLVLDDQTGVISGVPLEQVSNRVVAISASNSGGVANTTLTITVEEAPPNETAPMNLTYLENPANYILGQMIPLNNPSFDGGPVESFSISTNLPAGLIFDPQTGIISGTPTELRDEMSYTITATNSMGSTQTNLLLAVIDQPIANFTYNEAPLNTTQNQAILPISPSWTGGTPTVFSADSLPAGLTINDQSGEISGTPTVVGSGSYVIRASNSNNQVIFNLGITVNESFDPLAHCENTINLFTQNVESIVSAQCIACHKVGGIAEFFRLDQTPLQNCLNIHDGRVNRDQPLLSLVVTKPSQLILNDHGGGDLILNSAEINQIVEWIVADDDSGSIQPPSNLSYSLNPAEYMSGQNIIPNDAAVTGDVDSFSIQPSLPQGLSFNTTSGQITGTPLEQSPVTQYTVTAMNSGGSTQAILTLSVIMPNGENQEITSFRYTNDPVTYYVGTLIDPNIPITEGGTPVLYSVTVPLPAGLTLDNQTGQITGIPMQTGSYSSVIKVENNVSQVFATVNITIEAENDVFDPLQHCLDTINLFAANVRSIMQDRCVNCHSGGGSPAFDMTGSDLEVCLETHDGRVNRTEPLMSLVITKPSSLVVGDHGGGDNLINQQDIDAIVAWIEADNSGEPPSEPNPPINLQYTNNNAVYIQGEPIAPNNPSNQGGAITMYSINPALPGGLILNPTTGVITGSPLNILRETIFVVRGENADGFDTVDLRITVEAGNGGGGGNTDNLIAFEQTVYPLVRNNACISCHRGSGPGFPHFAHDDSQTAMENVLNNGIVDFSFPEQSRLVRKPVDELHNCGGQTACENFSQMMEIAITEWAQMTGNGNGNNNNLVVGPLTLSQGIQTDSLNSRDNSNVVALFDFREGSGLIANDTSGVLPQSSMTGEDFSWIDGGGVRSSGGSIATETEKINQKINPAYGGSNAWSVEAWVKAGPPDGFKDVSGIGRASPSYNYISLGIMQDGYSWSTWAGLNWDGGTFGTLKAEAENSVNEGIQHIVATGRIYNGTDSIEIKIYVDGQLKSTTTQYPGHENANQYSFFFGSSNQKEFVTFSSIQAGARLFQGDVYLTALYDRVIPEAQILQNYQAGVGVLTELEFKLDQLTGFDSAIKLKIKELDQEGYKVWDPTYLSNTSSTVLEGMRFIVNNSEQVSGQSCGHISLQANNNEVICDTGTVVKKNSIATDTFGLSFERIGNLTYEREELPASSKPEILETEFINYGVKNYIEIRASMVDAMEVNPWSNGIDMLFERALPQLPVTPNISSFGRGNQFAAVKLSYGVCVERFPNSGGDSQLTEYFGVNYDWDSAPSQIWGNLSIRDNILTVMVEKSYGTGLSDGPNFNISKSFLSELVNELMQNPQLTSREIGRGVCMATIGSAGTLLK